MHGPLDGDRIRTHKGTATMADYRVLLAIDACLEIALHRLEEVVAVLLRVKAENARAQHAIEQFLAERTDPELFGVGPRNVPEADDRRARQPLPDHARHQAEVIVLHQHDRIVAI